MKTWTLQFRQVDKERFEEIRSGSKAIETRANGTKYQTMTEGDVIQFVCGDDSFTRTIRKVHHWPSVDKMTKEISFKKVMPSVNSVDEMKKVYSSYPGYEDKIKRFGLIGFEIM